MRNMHHSNHHRRGIVSVVVLIVLMLIAGMIAQYARRALEDRRQMRAEFQHRQTIHLADAGLLRLKQKLNEDSEFQSETWELPAGIIHQTNTATVEISVKDQQATVIAQYPANKDNPVKVTKQVALTSL